MGDVSIGTGLLIVLVVVLLIVVTVCLLTRQDNGESVSSGGFSCSAQTTPSTTVNQATGQDNGESVRSGEFSCSAQTTPSTTVNQSTVVIYAYHCKPNSRREVENLRFLFNHGDMKAITMVLVSNGSEIPHFVPQHVHKLTRDNKGYDFEAWYHGLQLAQSLHRFEKFVFMNSSCKGPYLPRWFSVSNMHWTECFTRLINSDTKLVGLTVNNEGLYGDQDKHIQSMMWATDCTGIKILLERNILEEHNDLDFEQTIVQKEIGMSRAFLDKNFSILSLGMSDYVSDSHGDLHYNDQWFGSTLNPLETIFIKNNRLSSKYIDYLDSVHNKMKKHL